MVHVLVGVVPRQVARISIKLSDQQQSCLPLSLNQIIKFRELTTEILSGSSCFHKKMHVFNLVFYGNQIQISR